MTVSWEQPQSPGHRGGRIGAIPRATLAVRRRQQEISLPPQRKQQMATV
jgi:hypothetical protein